MGVRVIPYFSHGDICAHDDTYHVSLNRKSSAAFVLVFALVLIFAGAAGEKAHAISRETIIARAQHWVDLKVPYSQSVTFEGYRTDCSGFVSMAWVLPPPGRSTRDIAQVCAPITKEQLLPGDILLKPGSHVAIFAGWANPERTVWRSLEQSGSNGGAVSRLVPYPFWGDTSFLPYRYLGIGDDYLDVIEPVYGLDRYETAVRASWVAYPVRGSARTVVLATGESWPDALSGAALAGTLDAPVLLTRKQALPDVVRDEIIRLGATRVIVLGGKGAVDELVLRTVDELPGVSVERIEGRDRYETAAQVARTVAAERAQSGRGPVTGVYLATGSDFPDALAVSPAARFTGRPILLTAPSSIPTHTIEALADLGASEVWILGGEGAIEETVSARIAATGAKVSRVFGHNRYTTALAVAAHSESIGLRWAGLGVASGTSFPDALAGGVAQGRVGSLMLLTPSDAMVTEVESAIRAKRGQIGRVRCYGGYAAIKEVPRARIAHAMRGVR